MMKRIITSIVALSLVLTVSACIKKAPQAELPTTPITLIVMDTTQALLFEAQVQVGKKTLTTSYDGRIILTPDLFDKSAAITVSCPGFKSQKIQVTEASPLLVFLVSDGSSRRKPGREDIYCTGVRPKRTGVMYRRAEADGVVEAMALGAVAEEYEVEKAMPRPTGAVAPANVAAGMLTAGEVNDFAKWQLWPSILDDSHQKYIKDWRLEPRQRYTVQLINKDGYPLSAYPVNLTDAKGNTLFQAVTDNTGKAELWSELIVDSQKSKVEKMLIQVGDRKQEAKDWTTFILDEPCQSSISNLQSPMSNGTSDVDVMFVFDATGSMGDELRYLQAEMKDVIARAKDATGGLAIRTGAVVYRDHSDEYITRISRLTEDITTTQAFIDKQEAQGGGDYPEAVPEALMAALNSGGWDIDARARIAFLILDAPCHQDSATITLLHDQVLNAAALGVRIVPVVCSGLGESGELLVRAIALATNGTSFFLTDDSGIGRTHLKPTTDSLVVEHLNDMLVRTIVEFSAMPSCLAQEESFDFEQSGLSTFDSSFIPNPFTEQELAENPSIPHGEGIHYLVDISGKLLGIFTGEVNTSHLPIGVYFIKTYVNGQWFTQKFLKR